MVRRCWQRIGVRLAAVSAWCTALGAGGKGHPIERLDPLSRAKVIMGLLGLVLVGLAAMAFVWMGGRWARRMVRDPKRPRGQSLAELPSDWDPPRDDDRRPDGPR